MLIAVKIENRGGFDVASTGMPSVTNELTRSDSGWLLTGQSNAMTWGRQPSRVLSDSDRLRIIRSSPPIVRPGVSIITFLEEVRSDLPSESGPRSGPFVSANSAGAAIVADMTGMLPVTGTRHTRN